MGMDLQIWEERQEQAQRSDKDARDAWDIDYSRIIHSSSFRRLQGKTQILNLGDSDFYRNRLTHSLEVAQIADGIVSHIRKNFIKHAATPHLPARNLIHSVSLGHDLGHPPFGHDGEIALNYCMRDHGGFEANGQSLRILSKLENYSRNHGANLARRTLLGILKYPVPYSAVYNKKLKPALLAGTETIKVLDTDSSTPPKCYMDSEHDVVDWILQPLSKSDRKLLTSVHKQSTKDHLKSAYKSLDCSIMDIADDIAYGIHDLEDAVAMNLITREVFIQYLPYETCTVFLDYLCQTYPSEFTTSRDAYENGLLKRLFGTSRKRWIGRLVHFFISRTIPTENMAFHEPLLRYNVTLPAAVMDLLRAFKTLILRELIKTPRVQQLEFKGQKMILSVFEAFSAEPERLLPHDTYLDYERATDKPRIICDYVAGMTNAHLLRTYDRLFSPRMGSIFDKL
jgi:dGTPase